MSKNLLKLTATMLLGLALAFLLNLSLAKPLPAKPIYQFPPSIGTSWLEGVLALSNGDLLLTTITPSASIYTLSRPWDAEPKIPSNITLPNHLTGALSLADLGGNKYAVAAAKFHDLVYLDEGTSEVWLLDLNNPEKPKYHRVASMPEAGELNDMVLLKDDDGSTSILVADATFGRIWKVSISTGKYSIWLSTPSMKPIPNTSPGPFGINGLRYSPYDGYLYFTNTNTHTISRIHLPTSDSAPAPGDVELVLEIPDVIGLDSFAIDKENRLWVASNFDNKLILVERDGSGWESQVVLGGDRQHIVAGDTAVAFGRGEEDDGVLYVATSGAYASPVPPNGFVEPAKVVRVDVSGYF